MHFFGSGRLRDHMVVTSQRYCAKAFCGDQEQMDDNHPKLVARCCDLSYIFFLKDKTAVVVGRHGELCA